jgi:DNA repair protein RadA/Sms
MMRQSAKKKTAFFCTECGAMHHRWQGQCRSCGAWNTLAEEHIVETKRSAKRAGRTDTREISEISDEHVVRLLTGVAEFDTVLGGGAVPGSAILIGGEPGIGKSTLLLQVADSFDRTGRKVLYVTGEESPAQIKERARRFDISGSGVTVANCTDLDEIMQLWRDEFGVAIIDSIQTVASPAFDSPPGTVGQVRESAARLIDRAKQSGAVLFLIGHVTKEGTVAGPKLLEHMVDTVLYFEGDRYHLYRLLRSQKNRFGPTGEIGAFEMTGQGLLEIANPSQLFMSGTDRGDSSGRVVSAAAEGSRSFLVEVEALVASSPYGTPQRVATGIDNKRLAIITAVLEKRGGVTLGGNDIFVTIAGGLSLDDTALDLAFLVAVASSRLNRAVDQEALVVGEIGLSGDIRGVARLDRRVAEAAKLGLRRAIVPKVNRVDTSGLGIELVPVSTVSRAIEAACR